MFTVVLIGLLLLSTIVLTRWVPHHPRWRPLVIALNLIVSLRYLWWRGTETLNWDGGWGMAVSLTTYLAEIYGFLVVLHHYSIATRSRDRTSRAPDAAFRPSVDIMVASYNETGDILTRTLVGCQAIDYPNKRIHLLDDGNRPEIAALCAELGVNYIKRDNNRGAKAGNLNHALGQTNADFVVTFDADHVPVSSFLAETLGHFRESDVAQVQTAHHFYNPDLFQGRLRSQEYIANEQDMFYHIVQPGRDVDNASFYCGSGAVFRRAAIEQIGGFPMTTVTEDLHTSMLLHSRGWRTVYFDRNLSAGLAPESFDAYLTQRKRWSRGTMQVMLLRGGLFLPKLTIRQRIHYFATLWYWLYGMPRVVYIVSPLLFLLFGLQPLVVRDMRDLVTFYLPHLFVSVAAFQLVNRGMRRIFWSDIYESCIAMQMALTALAFPFAGWRVHFAVTPKGQDAERGGKRGVWTLGWPLVVLSVLMVAGIANGALALTGPTPDKDSTLINLFWAGYNLVILSFGLLLLRKQPQRRSSPRLPREHACHLRWPGTAIEGTSTDLSETGISLRLARPHPLPTQFDVTVTSREGRTVTMRSRLVRSELQDGHVVAAVRFVDRTSTQHRRLIELMYSAPDSWNVRYGLPMGATEHLRRILHSLVEVFSRPRTLRRLSPRFSCDLAAVLTRADGAEMPVRASDISFSGIGVSIPAEGVLPTGLEATLTIDWNDYERTTFDVRVANIRAEGDALLGLTFVRLDGQQQNDLLKHLDPESYAVKAERKAA